MNKSSKWKSIARLTGGGIGSAAIMDAIANPDKSLFKAEDWDKRRAAVTALNVGIGALGAESLGRGLTNMLSRSANAAEAAAKAQSGMTQMMGGIGAIGMLPAKDLLINAQHLPNKIDEVLDATNTKLKNAPTDSTADLNKTLKYVGAGALGLGAAGLAAKLLTRNKAKKEVGHIRYRIPGKNGDPSTEAIVELPLDTAKLSPAMLENIETNIKRQAVKNIKANMRKRDPETGKLIPMEEYEAKYGMLKGAGVLTRNSEDGRPVSPSEVHTHTDDFTLEDFYKLQAGGSFNAEGGTVKTAARAYHEGAGSVITSLLGAAAGGYLGDKFIKTTNPNVGRLAGAAMGALTPFLLGRGIANLQEEARSEESQAAHDSKLPALEYLLPGYAEYHNSRRRGSEKAKAMQAVGASFGATGMNPIPPTQGGSLTEADEADELTGRADEEDEFAEISKFAGAPPPPPPPGQGPQQGGPKNGTATAPVRNQSQLATNLTSKTPGALTARFANVNQAIQGFTRKA
jgi:hypothetical protein